MKARGNGLNSAPLDWQQEVDTRLQSARCTPHPLDNCCYVSYDDKDIFNGFVLLSVNDLLGMGEETDKAKASHAARRK
eukprot:12904601-Prorocentrum_lima.AAC.1